MIPLNMLECFAYSHLIFMRKFLPLLFLLVGFFFLFSVSAHAASWWQPYADNLVSKGVINAADEIHFRPSDNVNRAELAHMINRAVFDVYDKVLVKNPNFADVSEKDWFYTDVAALENLGIVRGVTLKRFEPGTPVTRAAALKMIALAFELPANCEQLPFGDVRENDWFYSYICAGYSAQLVSGVSNTNMFYPDEPLSRAAMAKILSRAMEGVRNRGNEGNESGDGAVIDEEVIEPVKLRVTLAPESPTATAIPINAFNIPYTYIHLSTEDDETIYINRITVKRSGLGAASHFESVRLYKGSKQVGVEQRISSQTNKAIFRLQQDPIEIVPGTVVTIRVTADMNLPGSGFANALGIDSAEDIDVYTKSGTPVIIHGTLPLVGNIMATSATLIGEVVYRVSDPQGNTPSTYGLRATNQIFTTLFIESKGSDAEIRSITFRNMGSAREDDIANLSLYLGNNRVAGPVQMTDGLVTFQFYGNPVYLKKDTEAMFTLKGDLPGGFERTVGFDIYNDWDIDVINQTYGQPARVREDTGSGAIVPDLIY